MKLRMTTEHQVVDSTLVVDRLETEGSVVESNSWKTGHVLAEDENRHTRPNGCVPLSHQVAGHKYGISKVGILQHPDGTVLKQLQPAPRGPREMHFYAQVFAEDCTDSHLLALQQHLPKYYGTWASSEAPNVVYLKLEDVTQRFTHPSIMDVKIGRKSYDPFASREKKEEQIRKYPPMEEIGFQLLGMRVYQVTSESYISHDRFYGRNLRKETLKTGLVQFFHNGTEVRKDAVSVSICKIRNILHWFESQRQLHFFASSLLFVYEGSPHSGTGSPRREGLTGQEHGQGELEHNYNVQFNGSKQWGLHCTLAPQRAASGQGNSSDLLQGARTENWNWRHPLYDHLEQANGSGADAEEEMDRMRMVKGQSTQFSQGGSEGQRKDDVEVRMIDFAHIFPSESADEGYIYGLRNLLNILEQILQD
ncbi:inositol polyphosphate multikinase [Electrophorus electricus]|uniref:Kinase n=1 Tax=Electrophorus electricus TaxID=8005 RepID=A0A4W4E3F1_ELEEL|nr:inositol polyphosphate multikinase [Electrophorus electricus]